MHVFQKDIHQTLLYPTVHKHDLSFWIHETLNQDDLKDIIDEVSDNIVIEIENVDNYVCQAKKLPSKTIRLTYCSDYKVLSADEIMDLHYKIGRELEKRINVTIR